jgi:hypothetical protein
MTTIPTGVMAAVAVVALLVGCGSSKATTGATSTAPSPTTSAPAPPTGPTAVEIEVDVVGQVRTGYGVSLGSVTCTGSGVFTCKGTGITRKNTFFTVNATGATAQTIAQKLNALFAPKVHAGFLAARKAQRAAHRAAVVKARKIAAAKAAAHAQKAYCVAILQGQHNGLSINQVVSSCGTPGNRQHIAVTGLTEDMLYYGGFLGGNVSGGRSYQLVFTNGYLSSVNYY